jgi:aerotaxis receptor
MAGEAAQVSRRSHEAVKTVAETMKGIAESSGKIGSIIQVIEGVAFQTNILALNAAVEAARAGEQGRGFAVVASEVRALAQRTATAAREIRQLIEESLQRVEAGTKQTAQAETRMDEAMASVEKTAALLGEIRNATTEQEIGATQVNEAVAHLDSLTQQNAAMVEELAAAAKAMDDQVVMVHGSIRVFRLTEKDSTLAEVDAVALRRQFQKHEADDEPHFDEAIASHQQWRVTLRNAALKGGPVDAEQLRRDDCCELGHWLHGGGARRWGTAPGFTQLVETHRSFHLEAAKVADAVNQKQLERAGKMLEAGAAFVEAGKELTLAIRALREQTPAAVLAAPKRAALAAPASADGEWDSF